MVICYLRVKIIGFIIPAKIDFLHYIRWWWWWWWWWDLNKVFISAKVLYCVGRALRPEMCTVYLRMTPRSISMDATKQQMNMWNRFAVRVILTHSSYLFTHSHFHISILHYLKPINSKLSTHTSHTYHVYVYTVLGLCFIAQLMSHIDAHIEDT